MSKYIIDISKDALKEIDIMAQTLGGVERIIVLRKALGLLRCALREAPSCSGKRLAVLNKNGKVEKELFLQ